MMTITDILSYMRLLVILTLELNSKHGIVVLPRHFLERIK